MLVLGKRPRPMIAKLSELLVPGSRVGISDVSPSPRSPLDVKMQSPRGLKNIDLGGVGLGIVAALDKAGEIRREILPKFSICNSNLSRSDPIPVSSAKNNCDRLNRAFDEFDDESLENYSYVTCRIGPNNKSITKVYYDGGDQRSRVVDQMKDFGGFKKMGIFESSPASLSEEFSELPASDFLSSCYLCRAKLHGKDIYMYRGEKAFCSTECRSSQIMMDERKERCRSEASRSMDVSSSSSYTRDQIFSNGIIAV